MNALSSTFRKYLLCNLDQYVEEIKVRTTSGNSAKIMLIALPIFELKAALSNAVSTACYIPFACINLSAAVAIMFINPQSPAAEIFKTIFKVTPDVISVAMIALKTALFALGTVFAPLVGFVNIDLMIRMHEKTKFNVSSLLSAAESMTKTTNNKPINKNNEIISPTDSSKGFASVIGMPEVKKQMQEPINILKNQEISKKYKLGLPSGAILYGPPGCGKSFFSQKFVEEIGKQTGKKVTFHQASSGSLKSSFMHATCKNISELFEKARKDASAFNSISVIIIDEIDTVIPMPTNRDNANSTIQQSNEEERGEFLNQLERASKDNIFVIGTTNQIKNIDSAIIRPGRFDYKIEITTPDQEMREYLLNEFFKDIPLDPSLDLKDLAKKLENQSVAEIKSVTEKARHMALDKTLKAIALDPMADSIPINQEIIDSILKEVSKSSAKNTIEKQVAKLNFTGNPISRMWNFYKLTKVKA